MDSCTLKVGREELLDQINEELAKRALKPLPKLGDATKGEIELTGIKEIYDHSKRFFTDIKFGCVFPNGARGEFTIRFNANGAVSDGAVIIALVNGRFAVVKQWRPVLGRWTYEISRGFGEKMDRAKVAGALGTLKIGDLPLGTLVRELGEEVMASAEVTSVTHLGNIAQNSGTDAVAPSYFLVSIKADEAKLNEKLKGSDDEISKVLLWDADKVRAELGSKLCDNHTVTAVSLAMNYIGNLPRF
jgi:hypothetical protein